jgi:hypothetical protein
MADNHTTSNDGYRRVAAVLFMSMFAAQAGAIALSPVLAEVANDLGVATATAGQLRTVAGLVAGVTGLVLGRLSSRVGLGRQLLGGSALLAVGSLGSAAAPGIALLFAAQVPVGAGIAVLTTAATLAAAEWVPPDAPHDRALLGADRAALGMDHRHASHRCRGRLELALRMDRPTPSRGCRGRRGCCRPGERPAFGHASGAASGGLRRPRADELACG